jgi:hypothetical protein
MTSPSSSYSVHIPPHRPRLLRQPPAAEVARSPLEAAESVAPVAEKPAEVAEKPAGAVAPEPEVVD